MGIHGRDGIKFVFARWIFVSLPLCPQGSTVFRWGCLAPVPVFLASVLTPLHLLGIWADWGIKAAPWFTGLHATESSLTGTFHLNHPFLSTHDFIKPVFSLFTLFLLFQGSWCLKRWSKRKKWMKPQLGQSRKIASAPLSLLYIGKRTTKPSGSPDASCFLISFYGPCACRGTSLALLMIYGKQIKIKAAVGLHCAMSDPGPR